MYYIILSVTYVGKYNTLQYSRVQLIAKYTNEITLFVYIGKHLSAHLSTANDCANTLLFMCSYPSVQINYSDSFMIDKVALRL